jgi:hypothetical protein
MNEASDNVTVAEPAVTGPRKRGRKKGGKDSKPRVRRSFGPYKFDKPTAREFIKNIKLGCPMGMAASCAGIALPTVYKWIEKGKDLRAPEELQRFRKDYEAARDFSGREDVKTLFKASVHGNVQAAQWRLARRYPNDFGEKSKVELTGANGGSVKVDAKLDGMTEEEMAMRLVRATRIAKEILDKSNVDEAIAEAIEVGANTEKPIEPPRLPVDIVPAQVPPIMKLAMAAVARQSAVQTPPAPKPSVPTGTIPRRG